MLPTVNNSILISRAKASQLATPNFGRVSNPILPYARRRNLECLEVAIMTVTLVRPCNQNFMKYIYSSSPEDIFSLLLEREEGRNINVREKHRLVTSSMCLHQGSHVPGLQIEPTTQACALTGNGNRNHSVTG